MQPSICPSYVSHKMLGISRFKIWFLPLQTGNFNIALVLCQHYGISNQKLTGAISKENINALHCWPFVKRIHRRPMDSPHKEPLMQKASPCHDVIIYSQFVLYFSNFSPESKKKYMKYKLKPLNIYAVLEKSSLTHWGWETHICLRKLGHHWFR